MINGKELHISIKNQELKNNAKVDKSYSDYNFTFNQANGKLELTMISNDNNEKTIEVDLPTEELVKNVYYDNDNKEINIEWENGQTTKIPLSDLIDTYKADEVTLTLDNETKTFKIKESWIESLNNKIDNKVEKVNGKGLSTNDYTNSDKEKLDTLEETYASKEEVPTKLSQLEQDVEFGVSEEDVMEIVENNAEQTDTLEVEDATEIPIGTSETFDATSDEQIPTSKAVVDNFQPKLTAGEGITIDENNVISINYENGDEGSY